MKGWARRWRNVFWSWRDSALTSAILRDSRFDQFSNERGRQRFIGLEANCAFAGVVTLQFVLVRFDRCPAHEVKGAMVRGGAESDKHSVLAKGAELIANAFLGLGSGGFDGLAEFFERGTFVLRQVRKVLIDICEFGRHDALFYFSLQGCLRTIQECSFWNFLWCQRS